jgi:hypothetical protein
MQERNA